MLGSLVRGKQAYENDHLHSWQQIQAGSLADCQTTAANMNNYPGYEGADVRCWDTRFPVRGTVSKKDIVRST